MLITETESKLGYLLYPISLYQKITCAYEEWGTSRGRYVQFFPITEVTTLHKGSAGSIGVHQTDKGRKNTTHEEACVKVQRSRDSLCTNLTCSSGPCELRGRGKLRAVKRDVKGQAEPRSPKGTVERQRRESRETREFTPGSSWCPGKVQLEEGRLQEDRSVVTSTSHFFYAVMYI